MGKNLLYVGIGAPQSLRLLEFRLSVQGEKATGND